MEYFTIVPAK